MIALGSVLVLAMVCLISCDSSSGGGGGTTTSGGYKISDFAGTWQVYYPGYGSAGHTIRLQSNGYSTWIGLEECGGSGGVSKGQFNLTADGYMVADNTYFKCNGSTTYITFKFRLQVRSANLLKGERIEVLHQADGTVIATGSFSVYMTR